MFKVYISNLPMQGEELTRTETFEEAKAYVAEKFAIVYGEDDEHNEECADFFVKFPKGGTAVVCVEPVDFRGAV